MQELGGDVAAIGFALSENGDAMET